jgi:hypothetical protein
MRSLSLMSMAAILASAAACTDESIPLDKIAQELAEARCADLFGCCDVAERGPHLAIFNPEPTNEAECVAAYTMFYRLSIVENETVTSGRYHYDGVRGHECISQLNGAACGPDTREAEDSGWCQKMFEGVVALGGQCKRDAECADDGAYCPGGSEGVFGTCTIRPALGQPCTTQCASNAYCDASRTCVEKKANERPCDFAGECASGYCNQLTCSDEPVSTVCNGV